MLRERGLRADHGLVVDAADQVFGGLPGGVFGLAHDHVQADAELHRAARASARARTSAIFFATSAGGSPQVR
jgi:hypothetical protein